MPELKQFGRAGKHWISSISTTPLHYLAIDHDVGRWGAYFFYSSRLLPLTHSFPYLLLRHKIGLDFISGKGVNFKASSPHIFSRMSHIYIYLTKVVNLSTPSNADLANKINIDRMITAAYHPQTNGLDER